MNNLDFFHLEGTGRLPTIYKHTDAQLNAAIENAAARFPDFYILLHGIDAYMERRRRRMKFTRERRREREAWDATDILNQDAMWGSS